MRLNHLVIISTLFCLSGCSKNIKGEDYINLEPQFDLKEYFTGPVKVWGLVQDRSGKVVNRFDADIYGSWDGNQGTLEEDFHYYNENSRQPKHRTWHINKFDENHYAGKAADIIGTAQGVAYGNALNWQYEMKVPTEEGGSYQLMFDDWIWAMNDGAVINRAYLKKFGFTVAEVTLFMKKEDNKHKL